MKKSFITALILLITVSLVGLIAIQIYWIQNSITLRDAQFRRFVKASLAEVNKQLEMQEKIYRLEKHKLGKIILPADSVETDPNSPLNITSRQIKKDTSLFLSGKTGVNLFFSEEVTKAELSPVKRSQMVDAIYENEKTNLRNEIKAQKGFDDIQAEEVAELLFALSTIQFGEDLLSRLDVTYIDSLIRINLRETGGINADYHFGIFDKNKLPLMVPIRSESRIPQILEEGYTMRLLPTDHPTPPTILHIWFPNQDSYVIQTIWPLLVSSVLFTITIILAFAYTINTILRQKKLSEIKNDFINNMTHELKTPISTISLACEALSDPAMRISEQKLDRFVGMIRDENKRLGVLVENVLRSAVLDKSEMGINKEDLDIHVVIEAAIRNIELQASQKGGCIEQSLKAGNPIIQGDRIHLTNVVYNLLDNAIKYSQTEPKILVKTSDAGNSIVIEVSDNGIGIKKDDQKRIFDKLFRVPTGNVHNIKGFGLGLSYVKAIVEKHHGSVSVSSEFGKGSTFTIQLPYNYDI